MENVIFMSLVFLSSITRAENVIKLNIKNNTPLTVTATAMYQATVDSRRCTELDNDEGTWKRIPKRTTQEFQAQNELLIIPNALESACDYQRLNGAALSFEIKGEAQPYNVVRIYPGSADLKEQTVQCKQIASGPRGDEPMILCTGDIQTTTDGFANVVVELL